jgi:hypothetical protein
MSTFKTSVNHKFNLPDYTDAADVKQLSENWAKVDKALKQVATYYNSNTNFNLDTATDSIVLIPKSFSKDCPIASGFIYVSQHFFGEISATSNRTQIAFSYGDNALGGMAIRHYYGGTWSKWCKFYCVDDKPTPTEIGAMKDDFSNAKAFLDVGHGGTGAKGYNEAQTNLKVLSRLAMYYSPTEKPNIDTITDSLMLIPHEYSKNCPVGGGFVYIMQLFYGDITANSNRTQIAFPYLVDGAYGNGIAIRMFYNDTWGEWQKLYSSKDVVPIANGGTGASDVENARKNLNSGIQGSYTGTDDSTPNSRMYNFDTGARGSNLLMIVGASYLGWLTPMGGYMIQHTNGTALGLVQTYERSEGDTKANQIAFYENGYIHLCTNDNHINGYQHKYKYLCM